MKWMNVLSAGLAAGLMLAFFGTIWWRAFSARSQAISVAHYPVAGEALVVPGEEDLLAVFEGQPLVLEVTTAGTQAAPIGQVGSRTLPEGCWQLMEASSVVQVWNVAVPTGSVGEQTFTASLPRQGRAAARQVTLTYQVMAALVRDGELSVVGEDPQRPALQFGGVVFLEGRYRMTLVFLNGDGRTVPWCMESHLGLGEQLYEFIVPGDAEAFTGEPRPLSLCAAYLECLTQESLPLPVAVPMWPQALLA